MNAASTEYFKFYETYVRVPQGTAPSGMIDFDQLIPVAGMMKHSGASKQPAKMSVTYNGYDGDISPMRALQRPSKSKDCQYQAGGL